MRITFSKALRNSSRSAGSCSAFENVIRNAVRYSPVGAGVSIAARRSDAAGGAIEVVVRDEGPGVPEKDLALIFEPFYRVDTAREHRSTGGEGLGLAIAARAISVHGGRIFAANAAGSGLVVSVSLPTAAAAPGEPPSAAAAA